MGKALFAGQLIRSMNAMWAGRYCLTDTPLLPAPLESKRLAQSISPQSLRSRLAQQQNRRLNGPRLLRWRYSGDGIVQRDVAEQRARHPTMGSEGRFALCRHAMERADLPSTTWSTISR